MTLGKAHPLVGITPCQHPPPPLSTAPKDKLLVSAQAMRGLIELEPSTEKRLKYLDFVDI